MKNKSNAILMITVLALGTFSIGSLAILGSFQNVFANNDENNNDKIKANVVEHGSEANNCEGETLCQNNSENVMEIQTENRDVDINLKGDQKMDQINTCKDGAYCYNVGLNVINVNATSPY